jgi:hypothetical protein
VFRREECFPTVANSTPIERPQREPDLVSKRGVHYWFGPEWIRCLNGSNTTFGRIAAQEGEHGGTLYSLSKTGNMTYIQGSIQHEYRQWYQSRLDYFFLPETETIETVDLSKRR